MPTPKSQFHQQNDQVFLDQLLRDGLLDYLWTSSSSCVSPDQPGAGSCVCTGLPLFTADPRVRDITDEAYLPLGLHPTPFLHYSRAMVIISIFSYACTWTDGPANKFNEFTDQIMKDPSCFEKGGLNEKTVAHEDLIQLTEWVHVALSSCVAQCDDDFHAIIKRDLTSLTPARAGAAGAIRTDILQTAALFELLYPVKFAFFHVDYEISQIISSDDVCFRKCYTSESSLMQPVVLFVLIVSGTHLHKTVAHSKSGTGAFTKGRDTLPKWLTEITRGQETTPGSVHDMIKNWDNGSAEIFSFQSGSKEEALFKQSPRFAFMSHLPKFSTTPSSQLSNTTAMFPLMQSPISCFFEVLFKHFPSHVLKRIGDDNRNFIRKHTKCACLRGRAEWDSRFTLIVTKELKFIYLKRNSMF